MVSRGHVDATPTPSSGPRSRTRTAIMTAALAAWTRDFSASLTDIADRADVSRSTLHRYFPERQDLVDAVLIDSLQVVDAVATAANNGTRAPLDHLIYLLRSLVEVSDRVVFLFADPRRFAGNPHWGDANDASVRTLIAAAQAEGTLDPELPTEWIDGVYNAHIFLAAEAAQRGTAPSHAVADSAIRTFLGGVGVPRSTQP